MAKITKYTQNISNSQPPPSPLASITIPSGAFIFAISITYYAETTNGSFKTTLTLATGSTTIYTSASLSRRIDYNLSQTVSAVSEGSATLTESAIPMTIYGSLTITAIL